MKNLCYDYPFAIDFHEGMEIGERQAVPVFQHHTDCSCRTNDLDNIDLGFGLFICTEFQYCEETTGILAIVKYWLSCSKVADAPPRRQDTTEAPSFPAISTSLQKNSR